MKSEHVDGVDDVESPFLGPSSTTTHAPRKKPLTLLPLIALIFFEVSGGPFGTEDAVAAGGPLLVLGGLLIFPLLWSVPEALITAELATAFPENSGYVAWVTAAFGPFWGFQEGFWSWLSGVTDNSIYPVMLADNLRIFVPALNEGWPRMAFLVAVSLSLTYLNYRGLNVVGHTAMTTTIFIIAPFVLLCILAAPHAQPANWVQVDWDSVQWGTYLNILFWNLNYWDSISCLAGEVDNPSKTFPRALNWAVLLVVASYFLPTLAALGVAVDTADWQLGYYGKVAQQVGGNWLAWWIVMAAAASQIGQFQAEMSSDSYQLQGMAERGFLPKAIARRSRHGTPTIGILLSSLGVVCLASFSFVDIVELLNAVYCLAELLEFAAFIWLRVKAPLLPRPYRVPLPTWGLVLMLTPATLLLIAILVIPIWEHNMTMIFATSSAIVGGFVLYPLMSFLKEKGWVTFTNLQFDFAHSHAGNAQSYTIHATGGLNYDPSYNAEYVDVVHDGLTGIRTTGSSMDLGSSFTGSSRGPGSVTGSLAGFSAGFGSTPPLSPASYFQRLAQGGRTGSAPAAVAPGSGNVTPTAAAAAAAPAGPTAAAEPATPTAAADGGVPAPGSALLPAVAAVAAAVAAARSTGTAASGTAGSRLRHAGQRSSTGSDAAAAAAAAHAGRAHSAPAAGDGNQGSASAPFTRGGRDVSSFRVRVSSEEVDSGDGGDGGGGLSPAAAADAATDEANLIDLDQ